jgi:hypothetical protein
VAEKIKFPRGTMIRNKTSNKLFYVLDTPQRCRMFLGDKPAYAISPYIKRDGSVPMPADLTITIYEQSTAEALFVIVL